MSELRPVYFNDEEIATIRELVARERDYIELVKEGPLEPERGSTEVAPPLEESALRAVLLKVELVEQLNMEVA